MKYQRFEDGLKSTFNNAEEHVDLDALIQNIHQVPKKSNGRWLWLSLFILIPVLGVIGMTSVSNHRNANEFTTDGVGEDLNIAIIEDQVDEPTINAEQKDGFKTQKIANTQNFTQLPNPENEETSDNEIKAKYVGNVKTSNNQIQTTPSDLSYSDDKKSTQLESVDKHTNRNEDYEVRNAKIALPINTNTIEDSKITQNELSKTIANTPTLVKGNDQGTEQEAKGSLPFAEVANIEKTENLNTASATQNAVVNSRTIPEPTDIETLATLIEKTEAVEFANPVLCPTFKKKRWVIDLMPEMGLILPIKNLSNNISEPNAIFDMRDLDEHSLEGIQMALYGRVRAAQYPFYLKAGISYTRVSERMNLDTRWVEQDTTIGIISITQSQNGDTITTIMGDIITETEYFRTSKDHYYLHMFDLPVSIGYSASLGNGWRLGLEGGAQFNIAFSSTGKILEGTGVDSYTVLPASGRFRSRLNVSYFGGITLEKTIGPRSAVYITPRFRYFTNQFTADTYSINQMYQFAGLHGGYIYSF